MSKVQDLLYVCPVTPLQYAAKNVICLQSSYYRSMIQFYQKQRDIVMSLFNNLGFETIRPQGAYYLLVDISSHFKNAETASKQLLQKSKIATVPGSIFFRSAIGKKYIRVCFAKSVHRLPEIFLSSVE